MYLSMYQMWSGRHLFFLFVLGKRDLWFGNLGLCMWPVNQMPCFAEGSGASNGIIVLIIFGKLDCINAGNEKDWHLSDVSQTNPNNTNFIR